MAKRNLIANPFPRGIDLNRIAFMVLQGKPIEEIRRLLNLTPGEMLGILKKWPRLRRLLNSIRLMELEEHLYRLPAEAVSSSSGLDLAKHVAHAKVVQWELERRDQSRWGLKTTVAIEGPIDLRAALGRAETRKRRLVEAKVEAVEDVAGEKDAEEAEIERLGLE